MVVFSNWEIAEENYLNLNIANAVGKVRSLCPFCSHLRKPQNRGEKCLFVDLGSEKPYYYCHNCGKSGLVHRYKNKNTQKGDVSFELNESITEKKLPDGVYRYFEQRGISKQTVDKMKINYFTDIYFPQSQKKSSAIGFLYFRKGVCVNIKFRSVKKEFVFIKDALRLPYGIDAISDTDTVIIQEGEFDVLSSIECGLYYSISPPVGGNDVNTRWLDLTYEEYFADKKKIILAGDNDEVGKNFQERLATRLGKHRCFIVSWLDCKDGNQFLVKYGKERYIDVINNAKPYPLAGIFFLDKNVENILYSEHSEGMQKGKPCMIHSLSDHFSWLKKNIIVIAGYSNLGKTEFFYFMSMLMAIQYGWKTISASLEEKTADRFYRKLCEIYVGKRMDPDQIQWNNYMTQEELKNAMNFVREHYIYIKTKKFTKEYIFEAIHNAVARHGGDIASIDPLNKLVKERTHLRDDEYLVDFYYECEQVASERNLCFCCMTHINKPFTKKTGEKIPPTRMDILGGQATGNSVDEIIIIDKSELDRTAPQRDIIVDKTRDRDLVGIPGATILKFDYRKRRYIDTYNGVEYDPVEQVKQQKTLQFIEENTINFADVPF